MQESQLPRFPWDKLAIDITGSYLISSDGKKYIITEMDLLTLYPQAYPGTDMSTNTVAKVLTDKLVPTHPCPITILSDNGREYKDKF